MPGCQKVALLIFTAFLSHHIRDAHRRGIWFCPFGSTPPISKWCYISITCLLPHVIYLLLYKNTIQRSGKYGILSEFVV